ncbi:hypothetical protein [Paenibacillus sp. GYB003]|uniref:hypothetical protein n=1 Tax=Paenibacillus sp. GYB003 TaxID=2994392 RepID=UPI002F966AAF
MPHKLSSTHLINQADSTIKYPNSTTSAFTDTNFYANCGKTAASGTIKQYGCAICAMAMFSLYKGGLTNSNDNTYWAVVEATVGATNNAADFLGATANYTATIDDNDISVNIETTADVSTEAENGNICMVRLKQGTNSHYVFVDGWNAPASGFDRYLVADPDGGTLKTLKDTMTKRGFSVDASVITEKYLLS